MAQGAVSPQTFRISSHFVLWEAGSQRKYYCSPKITHFAPPKKNWGLATPLGALFVATKHAQTSSSDYRRALPHAAYSDIYKYTLIAWFLTTAWNICDHVPHRKSGSGPCKHHRALQQNCRGNSHTASSRGAGFLDLELQYLSAVTIDQWRHQQNCASEWNPASRVSVTKQWEGLFWSTIGCWSQIQPFVICASVQIACFVWLSGILRCVPTLWIFGVWSKLDLLIPANFYCWNTFVCILDFKWYLFKYVTF